MIYFTADLHFNHQNIIKYEKRPFNTVEEMNLTLVNRWNEVVSENDQVYILGDFTMQRSEVAHCFFNQLKGIKYIIRGNHDHQYLNNYEQYESDFEWVKDYYCLNYKDIKFVLFHYPILEWDGFFKGRSIHLYGHIHGSRESVQRAKILGKTAFNVGVDVNDFYPVSIDYFVEKSMILCQK